MERYYIHSLAKEPPLQNKITLKSLTEALGSEAAVSIDRNRRCLPLLHRQQQRRKPRRKLKDDTPIDDATSPLQIAKSIA
jgi:hypothetical protein